MFKTCQKPCMPLNHVEDYSVIICSTVPCECTHISCIVSKTEPNPPDPKRLMTLTYWDRLVIDFGFSFSLLSTRPPFKPASAPTKGKHLQILFLFYHLQKINMRFARMKRWTVQTSITSRTKSIEETKHLAQISTHKWIIFSWRSSFGGILPFSRNKRT